jgi:hypothetical protein
LFGSPVDPRLKAVFDRAEDAFAKAAPLWDMSLYLVSAQDRGHRKLVRGDSSRGRTNGAAAAAAIDEQAGLGKMPPVQWP